MFNKDEIENEIDEILSDKNMIDFIDEIESKIDTLPENLQKSYQMGIENFISDLQDEYENANRIINLEAVQKANLLRKSILALMYLMDYEYESDFYFDESVENNLGWDYSIDLRVYDLSLSAKPNKTKKVFAVAIEIADEFEIFAEYDKDGKPISRLVFTINQYYITEKLN